MNCRQLSSFNGQALDSVSGDIELSNKIRGSTFESEASGGHRDKRIRRLAGFVESRRDQLSRLKQDADRCRSSLRNAKSFELSNIFIDRPSFSCLGRTFPVFPPDQVNCGLSSFNGQALDSVSGDIELSNKIRGSTFESEASGGHRDKRIRRLAGFVESRRDQLSRLKPDADLCRWILRNEKSFELSKIFIARQGFSFLDRNFCRRRQKR